MENQTPKIPLTGSPNSIKPLHKNEIWLIERWRNKYKFGEITIVIQNGIPQLIKKAIVTEKTENKNE